MPQMAPIMWTLLYSCFFSLILLASLKMYFFHLKVLTLDLNLPPTKKQLAWEW